jgi:flagellar hook-basal body complex protein FliE
MAIAPISNVTGATPVAPAAQPSTSTGSSFTDTLSKFVQGVESSGAAANDAVGRMLDGSGDVHDAMIALQQADLAMQLAVQIRNKLVQAYQDIMRMPV